MPLIFFSKPSILYPFPYQRELRFKKLSINEIETTASSLAQSLGQRMTLEHGVKITKKELQVFTEALCLQAAEQGLSLIAEKNKKVIASCIVSAHQNDFDFNNFAPFNEKLSPIFSTLETATNTLASYYAQHKIAQLITLAVHHQYSYSTIGKLLLALQIYSLSNLAYTHYRCKLAKTLEINTIKEITDLPQTPAFKINFNQNPFAQVPVEILKPNLASWCAAQKIIEPNYYEKTFLHRIKV